MHLTCGVCGHDIPAELQLEHTRLHLHRSRMDHTGPHGRCWRLKSFRDCSCPEPVFSGLLRWMCICCDGDLNDAVGPELPVGAA